MRFFLIVFFLFEALSSFAQTGQVLGEWDSYPSLYDFNTICITDKYVYAGSREALYRYSFVDRESRLLSKIDGLSDVGISVIRYDSIQNITVIGYINGNVDIIEENKIVNISDIKRTPNITGSKKINQISFFQEFAYLSTDFGLVIIDLNKKEIKESPVNIVPSGNIISVSGSVVYKDSIFISTPEGVLVASLKSNLLDYSSWYLFPESSGIPQENIAGVTLFKDSVYVAVTGFYTEANQDVFQNFENEGLYLYRQGTWEKVKTFNNPVRGIQSSPNIITVASNGKYFNYNGVDLDTFQVKGAVFEVTDFVYDKQWIAGSSGIYTLDIGQNLSLIRTESIQFKEPFHIVNENKTVFCLYGGYKSNTENKWHIYGYDRFDNFRWENFSTIKGNLPTVYDIVDLSYQSDGGYYYLGSYGSGLLKFKDGEVTETYNDLNSPLVNQIPGKFFVRVTGVEAGSNGLTWVTCATLNQSDPFVFSISKDGTWTSYTSDFGNEGSIYIYNLEVDLENNLWFTKRGTSGLYVFNPEKYGSVTRNLNSGPNSGALPDDNVNVMKTDLDGDTWVGTNSGIAIFRNDSDPYKDNAYLPYFDGFPLLMGKVVTDIEVDGANRKWVATNDGLWLFNNDASEVILNFTTNNSPLPTNKIDQVVVDGRTGVVFILTEYGLFSYRGNATEAEESKFSDVKVFPNPVRSDFTGTIGISGLARNVLVKITDVYGNLVFETFSNGGTAVWDGRNYNGKKVETGVYLVFSSTADGEEGNIAKIVLIE